MNICKLAKISIDVPIAGQKVVVSATQKLVPWFEVFVPSGNTGSVYVGDSTVSSSWPPRTKAAATYPGSYIFVASGRGDLEEGDQFDLSQIYVTVDTAGDDAIITYPVRT